MKTQKEWERYLQDKNFQFRVEEGKITAALVSYEERDVFGLITVYHSLDPEEIVSALNLLTAGMTFTLENSKPWIR